MKPTFALIHAENVNTDMDSICHLIIVPVIEGVRQKAQEFFMNPEAPFYYVVSGIEKADVEAFPKYQDLWPQIQEILGRYSLCMSSAEGSAARSLYSTLTRLRLDFKSIRYCNAKAICRRTMNEVSYSLNYLSFRFYDDYIGEDTPVAIAERWTDLALKGLENVAEQSLEAFLSTAKIQAGLLSPEEFIPSTCKRDYSKRKDRLEFDPSSIPVDAQPDNDLYGMNVVFTGKMESMKRDDARDAVIRIGGFAPERLTMDTDFLVVGVQDLRVVGEKGLSGRMKAAAKYKEKGCDIEIIDEQDFLEMLNAGK